MKHRDETKTVVLDGKKVNYILRHSSKAKNMRLQIEAASGLCVIVPNRYDVKKIESFMHEKSQWILSKLDRIAAVQRYSENNKLEPGGSVLYMGQKYPLVVRNRGVQQTSIAIQDSSMIVNWAGKGDPDLDYLVKSWLIGKATDVIMRELESLSLKAGMKYNNVTIKDQKTRWGSCSVKGNLNFNWRLVMAPLSVIAYVILHELAHLVELNHSKKFWAVVETWYPDYRKPKKWLKENGLVLRSL